MADARGRERGRDATINAIAQADQDPGGEAGLRLGEHAGQELAGVAPQGLEACGRVGRALAELEAVGVERAPRPEPFEIPAIRAIGSLAQAAAHHHPIARLHCRVSR